MILYLRVSEDKYRLIEDMDVSAQVLAERCGVRKNTIFSAISHAAKTGHKSRFEKIEIDDEEWRECK